MQSDGQKIQSSERSINRVNNPEGCLVGSYFLYSSKFLIFFYFGTLRLQLAMAYIFLYTAKVILVICG